MTYNADELPEHADWIKYGWNLPPYKSKKFMEYLKSTDTTLAEFKKLPIYKFAVERGFIKNDKWIGKSDRGK